jgi:predicted AAA+ superfamily ATPase
MYARTLVTQLKNRMGEKRRFMQIITGPRQSGKTTAVLQALDSLDFRQHYALRQCR